MPRLMITGIIDFFMVLMALGYAFVLIDPKAMKDSCRSLAQWKFMV